MQALQIEIADDILHIVFSEEYVKENFPKDLFDTLQTGNIKTITVDAKKLKTWDSSFLALMFQIIQTAKQNKIDLKTSKMPDGANKLLLLALSVPAAKDNIRSFETSFLFRLGSLGVDCCQSFARGMTFACQNIKSFFASFFKKPVMRYVDFLFALEDCGPKALPIVTLISFMVGLILAFVGAVQLQTFGAEVYVASLVTIGMTRIMGAIMVGIIMAGRTGASFAATIGTMQVNEEIDALKTMSIPVNEFLVLPRLKALVITMPLLTMLADFAGILGGAAVGIFALEIPSSEFFRYAYNAWFLRHFLVGLFHSLVFGFIIALSGCYFGIYCGRDADSVGKSTTSAVVYSIVIMIAATGVITFCLQRMGI